MESSGKWFSGTERIAMKALYWVVSYSLVFIFLAWMSCIIRLYQENLEERMLPLTCCFLPSLALLFGVWIKYFSSSDISK
jgi:hypothetical protein